MNDFLNRPLRNADAERSDAYVYWRELQIAISQRDEARKLAEELLGKINSTEYADFTYSLPWEVEK